MFVLSVCERSIRYDLLSALGCPKDCKIMYGDADEEVRRFRTDLSQRGKVIHYYGIRHYLMFVSDSALDYSNLLLLVSLGKAPAIGIT